MWFLLIERLLSQTSRVAVHINRRILFDSFILDVEKQRQHYDQSRLVESIWTSALWKGNG